MPTDAPIETQAAGTPGDFYTDRDVMEALGFKTPSTVQRAIDRGQIPPAIRVGKRRLWLRSTWERFIESGLISPPHTLAGA